MFSHPFNSEAVNDLSKIYKRAGRALNLNLSQNCDSSFLLEKNSRTSYFKCDAFD